MTTLAFLGVVCINTNESRCVQWREHAVAGKMRLFFLLQTVKASLKTPIPSKLVLFSKGNNARPFTSVINSPTPPFNCEKVQNLC